MHARNYMGFLDVASGKNPSDKAGDVRDLGLILRSGRSPGEGHSYPL